MSEKHIGPPSGVRKAHRASGANMDPFGAGDGFKNQEIMEFRNFDVLYQSGANVLYQSGADQFWEAFKPIIQTHFPHKWPKKCNNDSNICSYDFQTCGWPQQAALDTHWYWIVDG